VEKAIRLSPRDPDLFIWYYVLCHAYTHLARDVPAIEWCLKSTATGKSFWGAWTDLVSAYAWRGQKAEAATLVIIQSDTTLPQLLPKSAVLLHQVIDHLLLVTIDPSSQGGEQKPQR